MGQEVLRTGAVLQPDGRSRFCWLVFFGWLEARGTVLLKLRATTPGQPVTMQAHL